MYSPELLDHFSNPRNGGEIGAPDASAQLENPACGDILKLTAKVDGGRIVDIRFLAKGCVPAMACGSAVTEMVKNLRVEEAKRVCKEELVKAVGALPRASGHAAQLAIDTLAAMLKQIG